MTENLCGTCKHFSRSSRAPNAPAGDCARWIASYQYRYETVPAGEVVVEDDEGWGAMVSETFGCVLWETTR